MAEQTISIPAARYIEASTLVRWTYNAARSSRPQIDSDLTPTGVDRYLDQLSFFFSGSNAGRVELALTSDRTEAHTDPGDDLSSTFESSGSLTIAAGGQELTVLLAGADTSDPYVWTPANSAEVIAFGSAVQALTGNQAATVTIRDFVPPVALAGDVSTGDAALEGDLTATNPMPAPVAGGISTGDVTLAGDLSTAPPGDAPLDGNIRTGQLRLNGTLTGGVPAELPQALSSLMPDPGARFPMVSIQGALDELLPQYDGSERLRALISEIIAVMQRQIVDPLLAMERALNPDECEGVLLDWIGERLGLPRPYVTRAGTEFFGFLGTEASGGQPFSQAPFFTRRRGIELVDPIGDRSYRILLRARARRLRGGADRETLEAILLILFGAGYLDESGAAPVLRTTTSEDILFGLASGDLFDELFPRPAGTAMTLVRT